MFYAAVLKAIRENAISPKERFHPFPTIDEREKWEALSAEAKSYYAAYAKSARERTFPILPARAYMRYLTDGNRSEYEEMYFERRRMLFALVIDECIQNRGENLTAVIDLIWAIAEESSWVIPAHNCIHNKDFPESLLPEIDKDTYIDLFSAETGSLLSWCMYLIQNRLDEKTDIISRRVSLEIDKRIFTPYLAYSDFWWMGLDTDRVVNNWNPWINENVLACALTMEKDETRRNKIIEKVGKSVDSFLKIYAPDGGCDEGPSYFNVAGGSYLDCLDLMYRATDGKMNLYSLEFTKNMALYIMNAHIGHQYYINFADAPGKLSPDGMLLLRAAKRMNEPVLRNFAISLLKSGDSAKYYGVDYNVIHRRIANLLEFDASELTEDERPLPRSHAFFGIQVCSAREDASVRGLYFAAKGGTNEESHNHNDIGNFIVYVNGHPALMDIGVETYSRKTFSSERYDIWAMQSGYHNTAVINGFDQLPGKTHAAKDFSFTDDGEKATYHADIALAYSENAGIARYARTIILNRTLKSLTLTDQYKLSYVSEGITLPLISIAKPITENGKITIPTKDSALEITFDESIFSVSVEEHDMSDTKLQDSWKTDKAYRTLLKQVHPDAEGSFAFIMKQTSKA
ncbi:MAG: heparinase II/III family protein [Clostridia bacterium]|nr:heparinase II/III family protein [Clostridia bacterium]